MDEFETLTPAKKKEGIVFVISGPSGSGKGTVIGHLKEIYPNLGLAVSATTRDMRPGERDGVEYFFKTRTAKSSNTPYTTEITTGPSAPRPNGSSAKDWILCSRSKSTARGRSGV